MDFNSGSPRRITFPAGVVGSTRCIEIEILEDIDQENNERFNVDFEFVNGTGVTKGAVPQTMVIIIDDDGKLYQSVQLIAVTTNYLASCIH